MPSLQLINSHLVIDINKGRTVSISGVSQATVKTSEMPLIFFFCPFVSQANSSENQLRTAENNWSQQGHLLLAQCLLKYSDWEQLWHHGKPHWQSLSPWVWIDFIHSFIFYSHFTTVTGAYQLYISGKKGRVQLLDSLVVHWRASQKHTHSLLLKN